MSKPSTMQPRLQQVDLPMLARDPVNYPYIQPPATPKLGPANTTQSLGFAPRLGLERMRFTDSVGDPSPHTRETSHLRANKSFSQLHPDCDSTDVIQHWLQGRTMLSKLQSLDVDAREQRCLEAVRDLRIWHKNRSDHDAELEKFMQDFAALRRGYDRLYIVTVQLAGHFKELDRHHNLIKNPLVHNRDD